MKHADWITRDYNAAFDFLLENEPAAGGQAVLETPPGLTVVLPTALPGLGVRFIGLFMAAPILVFLLTLAAFPFVVLGPPFGWRGGELFVAALCLALGAGLLLAFKLMLRNRDLFPRTCFVTLGEAGIGAHYSRWHRPFLETAAGIPWRQVERVQTREAFFPPAFILGLPRTVLLEVSGRGGETIAIPLAPRGAADLADELRRRIEERARR